MFPILNPPPSPYHPSGSSQCTSPKHPVSCIEPGLATHFIHVILHLLPSFYWVVCLFVCFWYWAAWTFCIFWRLIPVSCFIGKYFLPFWGLCFHFVYGFLCCVKLLSLIISHLFVFVFITLGGQKGSCCNLCQRVFCLCFPQRILLCPVLYLGL